MQTKSKKKLTKLPVTVICGFLGSGKTTLLNHLLNLKHNVRICLIVNDMGSVNIDAQLLGQVTIKQTKERLVQMENGCICCTLREDLMKAISKLSRSGKYDYLLVESSGISEPLPIAQAFTFENEQTKKQKISLKNIARLDTMVTVIDSSCFLDQIKSNEKFLEANQMKGSVMEEVPLSQLLLDQVEFANVLVLNKTDLVDSETLSYLKQLLKSLNPTAKIIESSFSRIDPRSIVNTKLFDIEVAQSLKKWTEELNKPVHNSETDEYNIQSFAYAARRPFHPSRIFEVLNQNELEDQGIWKNFLRVKGFLWIAKEESFVIEMQLAGKKLTYHPNRFWWVSIPKNKWGDSPEEINIVETDMQSFWLPLPIGDKRQEIIFIGQSLQKDMIKYTLDQCLLTEEEYEIYKIDGGIELPNLFPTEWNELSKFFQDKNIIREQDGEWEDELNEEDQIDDI